MVELQRPDTTTASEEQLLAAVRVQGEPLAQLPQNLYIPPSALKVILSAFEGPLDLLLYLIRKQNLDILDVPVSQIADQYFSYINLMQEVEIELAGEYLLMAAMLTEIKSHMLLPKPALDDEEGEDPRAELIRRLQEYEQFQQAAQDLDEQPRVGRELLPIVLDAPNLQLEMPMPETDLNTLIKAFSQVLERADLYNEHQVEREPLYVREQMTFILERLKQGENLNFISLINLDQGRIGVVVSFLAILELAKEALIHVSQQQAWPTITLVQSA